MQCLICIEMLLTYFLKGFCRELHHYIFEYLCEHTRKELWSPFDCLQGLHRRPFYVKLSITTYGFYNRAQSGWRRESPFPTSKHRTANAWLDISLICECKYNLVNNYCHWKKLLHVYEHSTQEKRRVFNKISITFFYTSNSYQNYTFHTLFCNYFLD